MTRSKFRVLCTLAVGICALATSEVAAQWTSAGSLSVTENYYTFLATTRTGDLLATTFNRDPGGAPIPALLIRNPTSNTPDVVVLCRVPFDTLRGFGGVACDGDGNFFVTGDTGSRDTSFVRKFLSDGRPDATFGDGGGVFANRRCLGVEAMGNYLIVAVDWAEFMIFDSRTGKTLGLIPKKVQGDYAIRDVTIDPKSLRLFAVGEDGIFTWGGGTPWSPDGYAFRQLKPKTSIPRVGEGISLDPFRRCVIITPAASGEVQEVFGDGRIVRSPITDAGNTGLTDSAISFDGTTLFVSDTFKKCIHVLRREVPNTIQPATTYAVLPPDSSGAAAAPPTWEISYTDVIEKSRAAKKPMLVYFRDANVESSRDFEKKILLTPDFNRHAQGFTCVFEDMAKNRLLAYRFGVSQAPQVVLFNAAGEPAGDYKHPIDPAQLFAAMTALNK